MARRKGAPTGRCQGCNHPERVRIERFLAAGASISADSPVVDERAKIAPYPPFAIAMGIGSVRKLSFVPSIDGKPDLRDLARPVKRAIDPLVASATGVVYEERGVSEIV